MDNVELIKKVKEEIYTLTTTYKIPTDDTKKIHEKLNILMVELQEYQLNEIKKVQ